MKVTLEITKGNKIKVVGAFATCANLNGKPYRLRGRSLRINPAEVTEWRVPDFDFNDAKAYLTKIKDVWLLWFEVPKPTPNFNVVQFLNPIKVDRVAIKDESD